MPKTRVRRMRRRRRRQRGGLFPLAALIPALIAGGKAVALGAAGGAASYGAKKGWKPLFGKEDDDDGIKRGSREAQTKRLSLVKKTPCVGEV